MITLRKAEERGKTKLNWLESYHSFSFGDYYDPDQMGFSALRVINDDWVAPGQGFGTHPHRDMEIITYVLEGALEHKDSLGTGSIIKAGDVQYMSAGIGILHSEFNPSKSEPVHLLQIWIMPPRKGLKPNYQQISLERKNLVNNWLLLAATEHGPNQIQISQNAKLFATVMQPGKISTFNCDNTRSYWIHCARGKLSLSDQALKSGDAAAVTGESILTFSANEESELLLFDLPA